LAAGEVADEEPIEGTGHGEAGQGEVGQVGPVARDRDPIIVPVLADGPPGAERPDDLPDGHPWGGLVGPQPVVRLGLSSVRGIGDDLAELVVAERDGDGERPGRGPYTGMEDLTRRIAERGVRLDLRQLEALSTAGVFDAVVDGGARGGGGAGGATGGGPRGARGGSARRRALWSAGAVAQGGIDRLAGIVTGVEAPPLPGMSAAELAAADLWATGVAPEGHPTRFVRDELDRLGVIPASGLPDAANGSRVLIGGVVTHRQRPATAGGTTFINLEDETGLINVVCSRGCWTRYRVVARSAPALLIRGRLEKAEGVINVIAEKLEPLPVATSGRSRDFR
jgi:error-prone DNA polymerase